MDTQNDNIRPNGLVPPFHTWVRNEDVFFDKAVIHCGICPVLQGMSIWGTAPDVKLVRWEPDDILYGGAAARAEWATAVRRLIEVMADWFDPELADYGLTFNRARLSAISLGVGVSILVFRKDGSTSQIVLLPSMIYEVNVIQLRRLLLSGSNDQPSLQQSRLWMADIAGLALNLGREAFLRTIGVNDHKDHRSLIEARSRRNECASFGDVIFARDQLLDSVKGALEMEQ